MGLITNIYQKRFLRRYDRDEAFPYYRPEDFPGLICRRDSFQNRAGVIIKYYIYSYGEYDPEKLILFCPGMGPGHTTYLAEIEYLCRAGYRVLTLDYTGCGASGGEKMTSVNAPSRDAMELLALLEPKEEVIPVGHSLGGYTALNVTHLLPKRTRAVIISGFINISDEMMGIIRLRRLADRVKECERWIDPIYGAIDNLSYLEVTEDRILWIHSKDDPMVNYRYNAGQVLKMGNPNIKVITVKGKKHNPNYTAESVRTMNAWIGEYSRLVKKKRLSTPEERKAYFADKPIGRMTQQDPEIFGEILAFIRS